MDQGETVTVFNDLCLLAPAGLLDAPIVWQTIDSRHVRSAFTRGAHTVTAVLVFNDAYELIDFISDDRLRASPDGRRFARPTMVNASLRLPLLRRQSNRRRR